MNQDRSPVLDPYAAIADVYDLEHEEFDNDLELYLNLASVVGDPILELGCGTGRILEPLVSAGHRVTGLDASPAMLALAHRRLSDGIAADQVQLVHSTFDDLSPVAGERFGLAVIALNALMHVVTLKAQLDMLCQTRALLDHRGMLVIDLLNPTPATLLGLDQGVVHEGSWQLENGCRIAKFASRRVRPATQQIETNLWYDRTAVDGSVRRTNAHYPMRWLHRAEVELMLELAGFAEWHIYGGYDLDQFEDDSDRIIVTAEVTPA